MVKICITNCVISKASTIIFRKPEVTRTLGNPRRRYGDSVGKLGDIGIL